MSTQSTSSAEKWIVGVVIGGGLLICLAILWLFVFKSAPKRPGVNESAAVRMREFREAAQGDGSLGLSERFAKTREEWTKSAATLEGDERKFAEAIASIFEELTPRIEGYDRAYKSVAEAGYALPTFAGVEEIEAREKLIKDFQMANAALLEGFNQVAPTLKRKLDAAGVRGEVAQREMTSFLSGLNVGEIRQLREFDASASEIMLKQLALYRQEWGRWEVSEDGTVKFEDAIQQQAFDALQAEFQKAGEKQQQLLPGQP